jgi:N6-L-threonylcarbamoyladenine synthase
MMSEKPFTVLGIETSCDETAAAVWREGKILSNVVASQMDHTFLGGVVPELASRAHQQVIFKVVDEAIREAGIHRDELNLIGVTRGPGLMGSLHVGVSFASGLAWSLHKPLLGVHHMHAHIMAHFISDSGSGKSPEYPFICLTVSGGHTQLVLMRSAVDFEILGQTIDDAAGEALDKAAKILGLPYPGGPEIDRLAKLGDHEKYSFTRPRVAGLNFSFSGLKTALLYFLRDNTRQEEKFIENELHHICASYQHAVTDYLIDRLEKALMLHEDVKDIALAGGVSANSVLRAKCKGLSEKMNLTCHIPHVAYCTDNAAMIACAAAMLWPHRKEGMKHFSPLPSWPMTAGIFSE